MIEIEKPNITTSDLSEDGRHGIFIVEPLERHVMRPFVRS